MEKFADMTLSRFAEVLASDAPTPGGGGACAYTAAMGAALGAMVCALSLGKKSCADAQEELSAAREKLETSRRYLTALVDEDAKAFAPLQKCWALPKDDPKRGENLEAALRVACYIPTEVMYACGENLTLLSRLAEIGVRSAVSDIGVAAELTRAALLGSQHSIEINAALMPDEVFGMTLLRENELVRQQYLPVAETAADRIRARLEK